MVSASWLGVAKGYQAAQSGGERRKTLQKSVIVKTGLVKKNALLFLGRLCDRQRRFAKRVDIFPIVLDFDFQVALVVC